MSEDAAFSAGDVVRLRSGGPPMTVEGVTATGTVRLAWFDAALLMHRATLPPSALVAAVPDFGPWR